jgi:hypothetical protein
MKREPGRPTTTKSRAAAYDTLMPLLSAMLRDFQDLAKKKPDGVLNARKITIVNRLLNDLKEVVKSEPSVRYLDLLEEENVPQNSDVLLILGQFDAAMKGFHSKYYIYDAMLQLDQWALSDE